MTRGTRWPAALLLLPLAACSADPAPNREATSASSAPSATASDSPASDPTPSDSTASDPTASPGTPDPSGKPTASENPAAALPPVDSPYSLPALMREKFRGSRITPGRVIAETDAYTRSEVTYRSGDVTVSGVLLRPRGRGPFPGIVLNHGYIEP